MTLFAREGMGTHYKPGARTVDYVPLGAGAADFRIVVMDTGTDRPGLEKSTYKIRREECERLVGILQKDGYAIECLGDIKEEGLYQEIVVKYESSYPELVDRLRYIYSAQRRFGQLLEAWRGGDIETVGRIFRQDGIGLRDEYSISGPELETMCDIVRTVPGVLGERMLGGGDKGAAGALVQAGAVEMVKQAVQYAYPRSRPLFANKYAVHVCKPVDGVKVYEGLM
jgi:galactokinase